MNEKVRTTKKTNDRQHVSIVLENINLTRNEITLRTGKLVMNVGKGITLRTAAITSDTGLIMKKTENRTVHPEE